MVEPRDTYLDFMQFQSNHEKTLKEKKGNADRETARTVEGKIALVLERGANSGEFRLPVPPLQFARQFYTMIQGAVAMATIMSDRKYLLNTIAYLEVLLKKEIKI